MPVPDEREEFAPYPAHLRPVRFPSATAEAARATCDRIAGLLDEHLLARPDLVNGARDGWEGAYRQEFDQAWSVQETRLAGLKDDLRTLAGYDVSLTGTVITELPARAS